MRIRLRPSRPLWIWLAIGGVSLAFAFWGGYLEQRQIVEARIDVARRCASAVAPADVDRIRGVAEDAALPAYRALKLRLARLSAADPQIQSLYLVRGDPATSWTVFLADAHAESAGSSQHPGDLLRDSRAVFALQETLRTGIAAASPPLAGRTGALVLAFAPVVGAGSGRDEVILGVESLCSDWSRVWWSGAVPGALGVWMVLGLPFGLYRIRQHEIEQGEALRNLCAAVEQSQSAVMIVNLNDRVEYANAAVCQQLGYTRRELIGRPWRYFQKPDTPPEVLAEMTATVRAGLPWRGEWFNRRKNGELYAVQGHISPVKNAENRLLSFVAVFQDLTELKRNEDTLRSALERAEAGDRAKSRFFATMSHEVRTPLNGIVGFTSLLAETDLAPEAREYVNTIRTSAESLIQLTGDILDFAKIEGGSLRLEAQPTSVRIVVEETLELFAVAAARKSLELLHWIDDNVPETILIDDARLRQVLSNLLGNAVKFTASGLVELTVKAELIVEGQWRLAFQVRDTGIGIAPEHRKLLFRPFSQVDETTTRRHGGSGLGLAISRNLVQLMGGEIDMESGPGRGSVFWFNVPVLALPDTRADHEPPRVAGMRVALAAPPGPFRDEFTRLVQSWGAALTTVDDFGALADVAADVAVVELGEAAAREVAEQPAGELPWTLAKAFAVVAVTTENEVRAGLRRHFGNILNKPLRHEALRRTLAGVPADAADLRKSRQFGFRVLVVEDNFVNQRLVQRLLTNLGCLSEVAVNGRMGLDVLRNAAVPYDLVLMDLHMPELDGLGAIERIRAGAAGEAARGVWITVLTADARGEQRERVLSAGANDYLVKPVGLGELADGLQKYSRTISPA
jgi:PAS domain S-box-containing protein